MFVVGITQLAASLEQEATALAGDLGMTAYEARMLLAGGMPAIVLLSPEKSRAVELLGNLRGRGHGAVAFDSDAVVSSRRMFAPRRFHFEDDAWAADAPELQRLPFSDVRALIRASHESRLETTTNVKEKKFSVGRALLSGGLVMTKTRETSTTTRVEQRQEVLYVFRRSAQAPWILRESGTRYDGLGDKMASTEHANFAVTVDILRSRAPAGLYDDRLVSKKVPERIAQTTIAGSASDRSTASGSEAGMDLLAHLLTLWLVKGGPAT